MLRLLALLAYLVYPSTVALSAAESGAADVAATMIATRAAELSRQGDVALARQLEEVAAGLRAKRFTVAEAQQLLAVAQSLPPVRPTPPLHAPAMTADQASAALDGRLSPPPAAALAPPPPAPSAAVTVAAIPPPPAGPEPMVIGKVLAVEPGADGRPALLAVATDAKAGVKEGQRLAVRRDHATVALARVTQVKPDLTIALLIPGTWSDDKAEIRVDDEVALIDR